MSSGTQHYQAAEQMLAAAQDYGYADATLAVAGAQVHAALAVAAATALNAGTARANLPEVADWLDAAKITPAADTTQPPASEDRAAELAAGLRAIADVVEASSGEQLNAWRYGVQHLLMPTDYQGVDPASLAEDIAQAAAASGAVITDYDTEKYIGRVCRWGAVDVQVYYQRPGFVDDEQVDDRSGGA
jgi:hypothetical protein